MATINLTNRYNNQDKRYAEAVVVAVAGQLDEGGQRVSTPPTYLQQDDNVVASVVEAQTIVKRAYVIVDEAFPAATVLNITVAGVNMFTDVPADALGAVVSTVEDEYVEAGGDVDITVSGGAAGDVLTGVARVVLDTVSLNIKNGNYANVTV